MRTRTSLLTAFVMVGGCTADHVQPSDDLRERAVASDGKADGSDLCAAFGFYGDGQYCDCFCPGHDPDCDDPTIAIYGPTDLCETSCDGLDPMACEAEPGCAWVTEPGFPGPISFCTDEPAPPPTDCDGLGQMACESTPECEWFTDNSGFPGPISFCRVEETPPPTEPCEELADPMTCEATPGCEWFTDNSAFPGPISYCRIEEMPPPPPPGGPCETLPTMDECEATMGCRWVTRPGFPGPISSCEQE